MRVDLDKIEEFFATQLLRDEDIGAELLCFDGVLHWRVMWDAQRPNLHITADFQWPPKMNAVLEVGIHECSDMSLDTLTSGEAVLSFYRAGYGVGEPDSIHVMMTKTVTGQFSFAANIGKCNE